MSASLFDNLDLRLNDVPLPDGLLARLRSIPLAADADLDAALADVPLPAGLMGGLTKTAHRRSRWRDVLRHAAAAVLIFAVSLGYTLSAVAFVRGRFDERALDIVPLSSLVLVGAQGDAWIEQGPTELEPPVIELAIPVDHGSMVGALDSPSPPYLNNPRLKNASLPAGELMAMAALADETPFGSMPVDAHLYDSWPIERPSLRLANRGAVDLRFWRRTGILPWLTTSDRSASVPLADRDTSYRLVLQKIHSGRLPAASDVRCEEFLAGIDFGPVGHDAPRSPFLAAAPSPFAPPYGDNSAANPDCAPPAARRDGLLSWKPDALARETLHRPSLTRRASIGRCAMRANSMTSRWLLVVAVTPERSTNGRAFDRRLSLEFASDCIAAYRVIGYGPPEDRAAGRPKDDDDDRPATPSVAVVLCEIEMKDGCQRGDDIVRVSLEPADDASSDSRSKRISAVLRASDFSSDFDAAPLIWRQAALVGLAAERFAGSPFAEEHPLGEIAALAQQLEPEVYDRAGWQEFIAALARAQSLQSSLLRAF